MYVCKMYELFLPAIEVDPLLTRKKEWIDTRLATLEDKVREVNLNYAEVNDAIKEAAENAIKVS